MYLFCMQSSLSEVVVWVHSGAYYRINDYDIRQSITCLTCLNTASSHDTINGGNGDDFIIGGQGNDHLVGSYFLRLSHCR
jgi:hypothetical protein